MSDAELKPWEMNPNPWSIACARPDCGHPQAEHVYYESTCDWAAFDEDVEETSWCHCEQFVAPNTI